MASYMLLLVWLTQDCLDDRQGEKEQVIDLKYAETSTEGLKTQISTSLEENKQPQSETAVKIPVSMIGSCKVFI